MDAVALAPSSRWLQICSNIEVRTWRDEIHHDIHLSFLSNQIWPRPRPRDMEYIFIIAATLNYSFPLPLTYPLSLCVLREPPHDPYLGISHEIPIVNTETCAKDVHRGSIELRNKRRSSVTPEANPKGNDRMEPQHD